jgi:hypothetical protein
MNNMFIIIKVCLIPKYRQRICSMLPALTMLDAEPIVHTPSDNSPFLPLFLRRTSQCTIESTEQTPNSKNEQKSTNDDHEQQEQTSSSSTDIHTSPATRRPSRELTSIFESAYNASRRSSIQQSQLFVSDLMEKVDRVIHTATTEHRKFADASAIMDDCDQVLQEFQGTYFTYFY